MSENIYEYASDLDLNEIKIRLHERILLKEILAMERTNKEFIGNVHENKFSIIDSWFPIGAACVVKGIIYDGESTQINLITSLHKAFRILFAIWAISMVVLVIVGAINETNQKFSIGSFFALLMGITFFRLFLHGIYILARNRVTKKLEWILELKN